MTDETSLIAPLDEHNRELLAHVHPPDWRNPEPAALYDLVVIGGGTAGLVSAVGAAGLGARVAIVERALLGGDCLNTGCVPSKALLRSARAVREVRRASAVGVVADAKVDFSAVMARVRARRAAIAPQDSAARLASLGIDVFFGNASFASRRTAVVNGKTLRFRRAVIATGTRSSLPPIPGLTDIPHFTNENLFSLTEQPRELIVLGAGPVGCEMAQALALLGAAVTMLEMAPRVLPHEDEDASAIVAAALKRDGVRVVTGVSIRAVARSNGRIRVGFDGGETIGDAVLIATGRAPNTEDLNLQAAGVASDSNGIEVDDHLCTTNRHVFAAGDVCSRYKFTHAADAMARIVIRNALFFGRQRASRLVIPWCTYTFPEVAHVGALPAEMSRRGVQVITVPLTDLDRATLDDETEGFVKIWHVGGRVVGATIVAPHAGEMIAYIAYLMQTGRGLADLSATIFPYPTVAEALRKAGDAYRRSSLTPAVRALLQWYFKLLRR
jgi:pyruvate/2-oxoglutarate dehydrogenase complex dihydrolipoamide dehydrogenase (E3) component